MDNPLLTTPLTKGAGICVLPTYSRKGLMDCQFDASLQSHP